MKILTYQQARTALKRNFGEESVPESMLERIEKTFGEKLTPEQVVDRILQDVKTRGDEALKEWTRKLDRVHVEALQVTEEELQGASIEPELHAALQQSIGRVEHFHQNQPTSGWINHTEAGALGQIVRPLSRVAVYVPGGSAPLISTLIMTAVIAKVAGVPEIIVATPPDKLGKVHPAILVAAREIGIQKIFKMGGAQAIGALAYGTESVPQVDKIVGPGNTFVVLAKRKVFGQVGIESLPGPTETLVIADETASASFVVADLLAQAEHVGAEPVLVTPSEKLLYAVQEELESQLSALPEPNQGWARESVKERMKIVIVENLQQAFELNNIYAPEHLCLLIENPWEHLGLVESAGGVFVGEDSMEALGDYIAGPSHVMPTGGTARFSSPLNVRDFQKIISVVGVNRKTLQTTGPAAAQIARAEGLEAHARAIEVRLQE
ncbi:histidinol dehydrogenase [Deinococcus cellulosilyticus]|uniref:Histidinol dehydrogenase n=1 Tax=Deinococcus cellulosilyticus (strain DSM 18568 / NBRC 106333 / KACC 11606 / 5516J-15) TaxID=1223518 RepID=A0A511MXN6_DEIC1|nr:histidinol dehydrogenase [Deinococcus cellulosilyticus]GEM45365.1 histidinol dehydrogenase [Deinococcus cellulosilyticus NBRC 106333 = KACC 11606]